MQKLHPQAMPERIILLGMILGGHINQGLGFAILTPPRGRLVGKDARLKLVLNVVAQQPNAWRLHLHHVAGA